MPQYTITVERGKTSGKLEYKGSITLSTTCWWDLVNKIPANTYTGCSATKMTTKKDSEGRPREAIYFPNVPGHTGIFIHKGTSSTWSKGCIVIAECDCKKIYEDIKPKDAQNVTVLINDS